MKIMMRYIGLIAGSAIALIGAFLFSATSVTITPPSTQMFGVALFALGGYTVVSAWNEWKKKRR